MPPRIYLAGPDVFLPDPAAQAERKKALCAEAGFVGVFPMDNAIPDFDRLSPADKARAIFHANETMMCGCDAAIANCTPFRGPSMDVGTAYEIGFMRALGKPVFGYSNVTADYAARVHASPPSGWDAETRRSDVEDFGLAENLMIAVAILDAAGHFVTCEVQADRTLSDLAGFRRCLERAKDCLRP